MWYHLLASREAKLGLNMKSLFLTIMFASMALLPKLAFADTCAAPGTEATGAPSITMPLLIAAVGIAAVFILRRKK